MSDPNILNLLSEETYIEKMDTLNEIMEGILVAQGGSVKPTSWSDVQQLVRVGLHKKVFSIGDQLTCQKDGATLTFDVIGIDHDTPADPQFTHSMTLCLHNIYAGVQFDEKEAFYATDTELPAGTYHITIGEHPWYAAAVGKTYQFTLAHALPADGQIVFNNAYNAAFTTVTTYEKGSTTAIETVSVTEGSGGTGLGTINNAGTPSSGINSIQRALLGSNNYKESAIRQWLNSNKAAGSVWTPMTKFDRPPSWLSSLKGWMNGIDSDFLNVIGKTTINVSRNTVSDGGGYDTLKDKFFLLSRENVFAGREISGVDEGGAYPYYSNYSDHGSASTGADTNRIKYNGSSAFWWWLRSPYAGGAHVPRFVGGDGGVYYISAIFAYGAVPACNVI